MLFESYNRGLLFRFNYGLKDLMIGEQYSKEGVSRIRVGRAILHMGSPRDCPLGNDSGNHHFPCVA
jgi:hypothetical protein